MRKVRISNGEIRVKFNNPMIVGNSGLVALCRKLLEVDAGAGRITALAAEAGCHDQLLAIEPSPHFFNLLRRRACNLPKTILMRTQAAKLLPEYAAHFDSVYSVHVMEHVEHDRQLLEEMLALTRPGRQRDQIIPSTMSMKLDMNMLSADCMTLASAASGSLRPRYVSDTSTVY